MSDMVLESGPAARALLSDERFLDGWARLYDACPWATPFQGQAYARTWYDVYDSVFSPLIVAEFDSARALTGLLTLATQRATGRLVVAGAHQAEYQAWLAPADDPVAFAARAWERVRRTAPSDLTFTYLPPGMPVESVRAALAPGRAELAAFRRPLMSLSAGRIAASLKKKSNSSRLNRLRREGEVQVEVIADGKRLKQVLDEIIRQYDLRQGALHGVRPFASDPLKEAFHLALLEHPRLLHASVLRVGEQVACAHIGVESPTTLHLGILAHSPLYAEHSPGKLHLLLLGRQLAEEGLTLIDLTPGDDPWKERFADAHDEVYRLTLYRNRWARWRAGAVRGATQAASRAMRLVNVEPARVREHAGRMLAAGPRAALGRLLHAAAIGHPTPDTVEASARLRVPEESA